MLDFRTWGHPGCGGRYGGQNFNFGNFVVHEPIWSFYNSKCSQWNIKGGYFYNVLGFEVTEGI